MPNDREEPPRYTRYRAGRRLLPRREEELQPGPRSPRRADEPPRRGNDGRTGARAARWRRWAQPKRIFLTLLALVAGWLALSLVLFLVSSHFERTSLQSNVASVLDPAGNPLTSTNNILVLGSDRREKDSKEPGAETTGFGRSDTIMLIRTGGGHAARLSIPRDNVLEIPGYGMQKINAAHEFGGPALSVTVIKTGSAAYRSTTWWKSTSKTSPP